MSADGLGPKAVCSWSKATFALRLMGTNQESGFWGVFRGFPDPVPQAQGGHSRESGSEVALGLAGHSWGPQGPVGPSREFTFHAKGSRRLRKFPSGEQRGQLP